MGRPRGGKVSSSSDATTKVDEKSKAIVRTSGRERKELMQSYVEETSGSEKEEKEEEEVVSNFEESLSESVSEPESSGSEYGVKKKKLAKGKGKVASPAKGKRGRKPAASPKGRGRKSGAAAKKSPKGRAGRKPAKSSASPTKTRPSRGQANKRMKYRERSDSEEEDSPVLSDSEVEEVMSESDVEEVDSGSDHGASAGKGRKRKAPQEKPKGRAAAAGKSDSAKNGRGRKPSKAKKIESEDEEDMEEDIDEEEEDGGDSKVKDKPKGKSSRGSESKAAGGEKDKKKDEAKNGGSEGSGGSDQSGEEDEDDEVRPVKAKPEKEKPVAKSAVAEDKSKDKKEEEDDDEDTGSVGDGEESVKSSKSGKSDKSGKSEDSFKGEKVPKNPTETDYKSLSFDCDKKTQDGDAPNFRISSWNIGGIKSWIKKNGLEYLKRENPDVMCLQEIKSSEKTQPPEVKSIENYPHTYWSFSENAGHHGVGILSKVKPENVTYGLPIKDGDSEEEKKLKEGFNKEGRLLVAEYDKFILINAYVPNGGRAVKPVDGSGKPYPPRVTNGDRVKWDKLFRDYVKQLDAKKPVVLAGDLNVAYEEIDLANPKTNTCNAGFTKEERDGFGLLLKETGVVDSYRELYGDEKGAYTFWSYMQNARAKNVGWRLDYFLLSTKLLDSLVDNKMRTKILGSDHCPITLFLHL